MRWASVKGVDRAVEKVHFCILNVLLCMCVCVCEAGHERVRVRMSVCMQGLAERIVMSKRCMLVFVSNTYIGIVMDYYTYITGSNFVMQRHA